MYRVIIIDDEPMMRMAILNLIEWESIGCEIVGEFANGLEALKCLDETAPDVILTDIIMPEMDGIELIKQVHEKKTDIAFIILSSHDDFQYVREALLLGARDYLLKTEVDAKTLISIVQKILLTIKKPLPDKDGKNVKQLPTKTKEEVLDEMIERGLLGNEEKYAALLNIKTHSKICMALISIDDRLRNQVGNDPQMIESVVNTIKQIGKENLPQDVIYYKKQEFLMIFHPERIRDERMHNFTEILTRIAILTKRYSNVSVQIGVSCPVDFEDFNLAVVESKMALAQRFYSDLGLGEFVFQSLRDKLKDNEEELRKFRFVAINKISNLVHDGQLDKIEPFIKEIYTAIRNEYFMPIYLKETSYKILELLACLVLDEDKNPIPEESVFQEINDCSSFEQLTFEMEQKTKYIIELSNQNFNEGTNQLIRAATNYIKSNYRDNDLSLQVIADKIGTNASYLSRLFYQNIGMTYTDYVSDIRINKAKDLLIENQYSVGQIFEIVGFSNSKYFGKIFKKATGKSPNEYRMEYRNKRKSQKEK